MSTRPSPQTSQRLQALAAGGGSSASSVKIVGPNARSGHQNPKPGTTWFNKTFDVPNATEV